MAPTPDVLPVGDLPNEIGKTAARELAIHGVGPKAIAILGDALAAKGLRFRAP
jgi:hypothetical protein